MLNLGPTTSTWWHQVVDGLALGLEILRDDCKVMLPKWLPYQTMVATLAAVLAKGGSPKTAEAGAQREKLKRWFWCAVFGQAYESAANSQTAKDVIELLRLVRRRQGAGNSHCLPLRPEGAARCHAAPARDLSRGDLPDSWFRNGARDFHTQAVITGKLMTQEGIDDHHVFPANYLEVKKGITQRATATASSTAR